MIPPWHPFASASAGWTSASPRSRLVGLATCYVQVGDAEYGDVSGWAVPVLRADRPAPVAPRLPARRARRVGRPACSCTGALFGSVVRCGILIPLCACSPSPPAPGSSARHASRSASLWRSASRSASPTARPARPPSAVIVTSRSRSASWGLGRVVPARAAHGRASSRRGPASCAARATSAPGWRSPTTAPACRPSSTTCSSAASACWPSWPTAATLPTRRPPPRWPRSRPRAAARSRRCARWSACCATTTAAPRSPPQPALTQLDGLLVRAKGAGARLTVEGSPRALPAGVELSRLPGRRAPARRGRRRAGRRGGRALRRRRARARVTGRAGAGRGGDRAGPRARARCTRARWATTAAAAAPRPSCRCPVLAAV